MDGSLDQISWPNELGSRNPPSTPRTENSAILIPEKLSRWLEVSWGGFGAMLIDRERN